MIDSVNYEYSSIARPLYSFLEADRLAQVTPGTSRRWLRGYHFWYSPTERRTMPPVTSAARRKSAASFLDLMEVTAIGKLRDKGFSLKRVRQINEYCQLALNVDRPLITQTFKVRGRDIFVMASSGVLLNVGERAGMLAWEHVLDPFLDTVEYEDELIRRWWPLGKDARVVVDPDYGFGLPVIAGTGVRTEIIAEQFRAGDAVDDISYDFGVTGEQIEDALLYEGVHRAA